MEVTRELPEALAAHGRVSISRKQIARLIGQVFLQRSAVNLLGSVLDVPDYFWSAPDHLQARSPAPCVLHVVHCYTTLDAIHAVL